MAVGLLWNNAARRSLRYLAHDRQPTNVISFLFSTLDIYTLGFFTLKGRNWVHSTFLYTQDFVFLQHVLHKHVLGGGIYLRKLPGLSLLERTFWVTFVWGAIRVTEWGLPSWESQCRDSDPTPEALSSCWVFLFFFSLSQQVFIVSNIYLAVSKALEIDQTWETAGMDG